MPIQKKLLPMIALAMSIVVSACTTNSIQSNDISNSQNSQVSDYADTPNLTTNVKYSTQDFSYDSKNSTKIQLLNNTAKIDGIGASALDNSVEISSAGSYIIEGELNGQIIINVPKTASVSIILNEVKITSQNSAAIYVKQADKVYITLAENKNNFLATSGEFISDGDNNVDAVVFSKDDILFGGNGKLEISTQYGNGIVSKDELVIASGTYKIDSSGHGIQSKDFIKIDSGEFNIISGKDGLHAENKDDTSLGSIYIVSADMNITSLGDGISSALYTNIDNGSYNIKAGGGHKNTSTYTSQNVASVKGIKASATLTINDGKFNIDAADDAIHSNSNIIISSGKFDITTSDDGIHADTNVKISNNTIINISNSYEGIEGESVDILGGNITITSSDDGINAAGGMDSSGFKRGDRFGRANANSNQYINIEDGNIKINATGDGIDSNGKITISGGNIYIDGPTINGNSAFDYDGTADITSGTVVAVGSSGMAQNFSTGTQGSILVKLNDSQTGEVKLLDSSDNVILSYIPTKSYSSVLISTSQLNQGETYTLIAGSTQQQITLSQLIYGSGFGGFGNFGRGDFPDKFGRGENLPNIPFGNDGNFDKDNRNRQPIPR